MNVFMVLQHFAKIVCLEGDLALKLGKKGSVFFNCHYFISKLISDFDFWNLDRHE